MKVKQTNAPLVLGLFLLYLCTLLQNNGWDPNLLLGISKHGLGKACSLCLGDVLHIKIMRVLPSIQISGDTINGNRCSTTERSYILHGQTCSNESFVESNFDWSYLPRWWDCSNRWWVEVSWIFGYQHQLLMGLQDCTIVLHKDKDGSQDLWIRFWSRLLGGKGSSNATVSSYVLRLDYKTNVWGVQLQWTLVLFWSVGKECMPLAVANEENQLNTWWSATIQDKWKFSLAL